MPAIIEDESAPSTAQADGLATLPFPPVTRSHIMHCSYHSWHPKYRTITPKARLIPLTKPFLDYLRADGIVLPDDDDNSEPEWSDDSGIFSASDNPDAQDDDSDTEQEDVAAAWRGVHNTIADTIATLGGKVVPKLNWSAPKDATWMNANSMECRAPSDVYLLLKSSDFITHDLEHAFDDTELDSDPSLTPDSIPYHLVLRKAFEMNPSVEFRCFVRNRKLIGLCQRDLNHFDFLFKMQSHLQSKIQEFFDVRLRDTFPDDNFVFDVYVPPPHERVWLVDVNPWAPRTDPLLFSWLELLTMEEPPEMEKEEDLPQMTIRIPFRPDGAAGSEESSKPIAAQEIEDLTRQLNEINDDDDDASNSVDSDVEEIWQPEFRLVRRNDPEAYTFNTPQYSAHKLPKDVVDASQSGEGLREFARDWKEILEKRQRADEEAENSEAD